MATHQYDVVVLGATGFTGQLVVQYLAETYGVEGALSWAIAGRSRHRLEQVRGNFLAVPDRDKLPILVVDSGDEDALRELAESTTVVCTTVGPYAKYGTPLIAACVEAGTHYCDLTGEVQWMARIIPEYEAAARASGARIVHTCGFDSVPSDMGVWHLQQVMEENHGTHATTVKGRVVEMRGGASGGTIASILNMMEEAAADVGIRAIIADPYVLYPAGEKAGKDEGDQRGALYDSDFERWTSPFIMAAINTRVVRRSNALLDFPWGHDFSYSESMLEKSRAAALRRSLAAGAGMATLAIGPARKIITRFLPQPGDGPSASQREAGGYELRFLGRSSGDELAAVRVRGYLDPGYGSTSRMLGEAAVCLALDTSDVAGGFWTPASALGANYLQRLQDNAGLDFDIIDPDEI